MNRDWISSSIGLTVLKAAASCTATPSREVDDHAINLVNTLYPIPRGLLSGFRGVSMEQLDQYSAWFL